MATQDDYIRTALRVPPDLHARIHEEAKSNNRTFNAEIVARLQQSFLGGIPAEAAQAIEENASMLCAPNSPEHKVVVEQISNEVVRRSRQAATETAESLLKMNRMRIEAPDLFQKILDAGAEAGLDKLPQPRGLKPSR